MKLSANVKFEDLLDGHEWVSAGEPFENAAYLNRLTGKIHWSSAVVDVEEPLPDDIDDSSIYLEIPHKHDLDLGNALALRFVAEQIPGAVDVASSMFRQRGAYARFKDLLERSKKLKDWYDYMNNAVESALRQWCADNDILINPENSNDKS